MEESKQLKDINFMEIQNDRDQSLISISQLEFDDIDNIIRKDS